MIAISVRAVVSMLVVVMMVRAVMAVFVMMSAIVAVFMVMVMITGGFRIIFKLACKKFFYCLICISACSRIKLYILIIKSHSCTHSDTAAYKF